MKGIQPIQETEPGSKVRLRLWLRLLKLSRSIESEIRENLRSEFDSTLPRFDVMAALSRYDKGLKMSSLSGVLKVSNGNVTGIIERLVTDGYVIREAVPGDRRASVVRLTPSGRKEFARQAIAHEGWINQLLTGVSISESEAIGEQLEKAIQIIFDEGDSE